MKITELHGKCLKMFSDSKYIIMKRWIPMKKFFALMVALVLMTVSFAAFAAGSKTTDDVAKVANTTNTQTETDEALVIKIVDPSEAETAFFEKMTSGDAETMPEGAKADELAELLALLVSGAKEGIGNVVANLVTTTVYTAEQKVHCYIGVLKDEKAAWEELTSVVVKEDGSLDIQFTEKQLLTMQEAENVVLAVFVEAAK